jgi:hypothetical protein
VGHEQADGRGVDHSSKVPCEPDESCGGALPRARNTPAASARPGAIASQARSAVTAMLIAIAGLARLVAHDGRPLTPNERVVILDQTIQSCDLKVGLVSSTAEMVETEADPTPLVLSLARTIRASLRQPEMRDLVAGLEGAVALRSVADAQSATLTFDDGAVLVRHGLAEGVEQVELLFDPEYTLGDTDHPVGRAAAALLSPPLAEWRDAAGHFWEINRNAPGFPGTLIVTCLEDESQVVFGDGDDAFEVRGYGPAIAAVLSGQIDHFLYAIAFGVISVVGSGAHMSAMCAAHWKVRFGA